MRYNYTNNMGVCHSKSDQIKRDKNHNRQKMFRFGVSFGRNDLNLEGHIQMGYNSKTIKNYGRIEKQSVSEEHLPFTASENVERTSISPRSVMADIDA